MKWPKHELEKIRRLRKSLPTKNCINCGASLYQTGICVKCTVEMQKTVLEKINGN